MLGKQRWPAQMTVCLLVVSSLSAIILADGPKDQSVQLAQAKVEPGHVLKIGDPLTGGSGYWMLYIPSDYVPARKWPVIFNYHGLGNQPTAEPFKSLTDGKGFIVVGMEYEDREIRMPQVEKNLPNLLRIRDALSKKVQMDEKLLFIGGVSQGGFRSADYGEASLDTWAGMIILAAGRGVDAFSHPERNPRYGGKPIFIGVGEKDGNLPGAKVSAEFYASRGADVTLEIFPGLGHAVDEKNAKLKHWLAEHGPLLAVNTNLAAARADEKSGKLGEAYVLYQAAGRDAEPGEQADSAKASAAAIAKNAEEALTAAESLLAAGKNAEGITALTACAKAYAMSEWGDKAKARMVALLNDPAIAGQLAQATIDAAADAAEKAAAGAEKAGDFKRAIAAYQAYVTAYPKSHRIAEVREHLKSLAGNAAIQSAIVSEKAETDCKAWLSMAQSSIDSGLPDRARAYLQKVIDHYPRTPYAETAKHKLAEIK